MKHSTYEIEKSFGSHGVPVEPMDTELASAFNASHGPRCATEALQKPDRAPGAVAFAFFRAGMRYQRNLSRQFDRSDDMEDYDAALLAMWPDGDCGDGSESTLADEIERLRRLESQAVALRTIFTETHDMTVTELHTFLSDLKGQRERAA